MSSAEIRPNVNARAEARDILLESWNGDSGAAATDPPADDSAGRGPEVSEVRDILMGKPEAETEQQAAPEAAAEPEPETPAPYVPPAPKGEREVLEEHVRVLQEAGTRLHQDYQSPQLAYAKQHDPATAALMLAELNRRGAEIRSAEDALMSAGSGHQQAQRQQYMAQQFELANRLVPAWKTPAVRESETAKIREYLTGQGYTADQINNIGAREASVLRDLVIERERKPTPKLRKIGNAQPARKKVDPVAQATQRATRHGGTPSKERIISELLKGADIVR